VSKIRIVKVNESIVRIDNIDLGTAKSLSEIFSYYAENYKWHPKYKMGVWDGKIRLFNMKSRTLPIGMWRKAYKILAKNWKLEVKVDKALKSPLKDIVNEGYLKLFLKSVQPQKLDPRDYQKEAVIKLFKYGKAVCESPTSSGKSFIISLAIDIIRNEIKDSRILLIVPNISLIYQMRNDIVEYHINKDIEKDIFLIYDMKYDLEKYKASQDKLLRGNTIVISTWQSLQSKNKRIDKKFFKQFDAVLVDEAHGAGAKELSGIINACENAIFKFGFTGTLPKNKARLILIESLFGKIFKVIRTKELIEKGYASKLEIEVLPIKYKNVSRYKKDWRFEVDMVLRNEYRLQIIKEKVLSEKGVVLVLFKNIKNGFAQRLYEVIKSEEKRNVFYIDGSVEGKIREEIRQKVLNSNEAVIIASLGTFSTGINIPNLSVVVFAEATKSQIKTLQSIGRALRKHKYKKLAKVIDIVDRIELNGGKQNYLFKHFKERLMMYKSEEFKVKILETIEVEWNGI